MTELRRTPLHAEHVRQNARLVHVRWLRDARVQYKGISAQEHTAVRERAGLFDVSHMGEPLAHGRSRRCRRRGLARHERHRQTRRWARLVHTCCCNEQGHHPSTTSSSIRFSGRPACSSSATLPSIRDKGISLGGMFVRTPRAAAEFRRTRKRPDGPHRAPGPKPRLSRSRSRCSASAGRRQRRSGRSASDYETTVAGCPAVVARTAELRAKTGSRFLCANEHAVAIWTSLLAAGESARHRANRARRPRHPSTRGEASPSARQRHHRYETTNPIEAGLGWSREASTKPTSSARRPIARGKGAAATPRKLVGFEMTGRGVARHGYPLKRRGRYRNRRVHLRRPFPDARQEHRAPGICRPPSLAVGTEFLVDCRGRDDHSAAVVPRPPSTSGRVDI